MSNTTSRLSPDCLSGGVYITEDLRKSYPSREAAADRGFSIWALRFAGIFSITGSVFMGAGILSGITWECVGISRGMILYNLFDYH
ncbi:hypothetical protein KZX54_02720 [Bacillus velezensis]|uniref:hypothetical protein n=1 Tax=Bacillus velezensis TaxID=492670 RepID=UPI002002B7EF|nr:hypothetical protein [Bacillus velezensis]MCK6099250.1 hypothetical protein [Bacillus velezensis]MCK6200299.1 hypothetical protein [Bacillus velezensis]